MPIIRLPMCHFFIYGSDSGICLRLSSPSWDMENLAITLIWIERINRSGPRLDIPLSNPQSKYQRPMDLLRD